MAELKTKQNDGNVNAFLDAVEPEQRREDCKQVAEMMRKATRSKAKMWGDSIVGYGSYHYKNASGREGDWFLCGFSPRKANLTLYIMPGFANYGELMKKLGKYKTGKSCLYIKKLEDVDEKVLNQLVKESVKWMKEKYKE